MFIWHAYIWQKRLNFESTSQNFRIFRQFFHKMMFFTQRAMPSIMLHRFSVFDTGNRYRNIHNYPFLTLNSFLCSMRTYVAIFPSRPYHPHPLSKKLILHCFLSQQNHPTSTRFAVPSAISSLAIHPYHPGISPKQTRCIYKPLPQRCLPLEASTPTQLPPAKPFPRKPSTPRNLNQSGSVPDAISHRADCQLCLSLSLPATSKNRSAASRPEYERAHSDTKSAPRRMYDEWPAAAGARYISRRPATALAERSIRNAPSERGREGKLHSSRPASSGGTFLPFMRLPCVVYRSGFGRRARARGSLRMIISGMSFVCGSRARLLPGRRGGGGEVRLSARLV